VLGDCEDGGGVGFEKGQQLDPAERLCNFADRAQPRLCLAILASFCSARSPASAASLPAKISSNVVLPLPFPHPGRGRTSAA
jgi:hypothetical protein